MDIILLNAEPLLSVADRLLTRHADPVHQSIVTAKRSRRTPRPYRNGHARAREGPQKSGRRELVQDSDPPSAATRRPAHLACRVREIAWSQLSELVFSESGCPDPL